MKHALIAFAILSLSSLIACGGGSSSNPPVTVGTPSFLYVSTDTGAISGYAISQTGAVTSIAGPTLSGANPKGMAVANSGFLYVAVSSSTVIGSSFNSQTGTLAAIPGSPFFIPTGRNASILAVCGGRLYGMNTSAQASVSTINSDGTLGSSSGYGELITGASASLAITPNCKYLYFADPDINAVSAYTITGAGFGFTTTFSTPVPVGMAPAAVATESTGKFLYVANSGSNNVSAFAIDSNSGALTPVPGSPFATGSQPSALVVADSYLFVTNAGDNTVSAYTFDSGTGALTPVSGSPFSTGVHPAAVTFAYTNLNVSPTGILLFTGNQGSNNVSGFVVRSGGVLEPIPGSPFAVNGAPQAMVVATGPQ